ncbi:unnamed protein product [Linum trigynum]
MIMSLIGTHPTSAHEITHVCNGAVFHRDDHRRVCVYHLLDHLLGWTDPVPVGEYYDTYDCDRGRHTVYGYRWRADGYDGAACLGTAKDVLQNRQCAGHIGGRAWSEGLCYMRFEMYPIEEDLE